MEKRTKDTKINRSRWYLLNTFHFILALSSIWSLRNLSTRSKYTFVSISIVLMHSIIGFLYFSRPYSISRKAYVLSNFLIKFAIIPLLVGDGIHIFYPIIPVWLLLTILFGIFGLIGQYFNVIKWRTCAINMSTILNVVILVAESRMNDSFVWTLGTAGLVIINIYLLPQLSEKGQISEVEIMTLGLCFFVVFASEAAEELHY